MTAAADSDVVLALRFPARADRLKPMRDRVAAAAARCGCPPDIARDIVLAIDEACQNVIRHAYAGIDDGTIELEIRCADRALVILLRDFAETVDASRIKPRDLDDVRPGGLGVHFIRKIMDKVEFGAPPAGRGNLLRMSKRFG